MIYLDNNATTCPAPEVIELVAFCMREAYGNPSSGHVLGLAAEGQLVAARERVAALLGASPAEIVFNSGGTEGLNHAFRGVFEAFPKKRHFVSTLVEHSAVLALARWVRRQGGEATLVGVDPEGRLDLAALEAAIRPDTALISVMAANNETGVISPLEEVAALAKAKGVLLHVDATQAAGRMPLDVKRLGVDLLNLSAHKFHGPKGAGALYIRRGLRLPPLMLGGHQERDRRGGTENLPALAGMGLAARLAGEALSEMGRVRELRDRLEQGILARVSGCRAFGAAAPRLPNTSLMGFEGVDGEALQLRLSEAGICCSTGSACTTGQKEPSHVLQAMEAGSIARGALRLSLSRFTTELEVETVLELLPPLVAEIRHLGGGLR
nr:aminotransferase class V-fold PLP-dependent enzyme [uncultured Holophaga sp.]